MANALAINRSVTSSDMVPKRTATLEGFDPSRRGYLAVYREDEINHCPGCGRTHWFVGRRTAECAFCATAIPLNR